MMTTTEHTAAARRAASRQRVAGAVVLAATDDAGLHYTMVLSAKEPGKAYVLTRDRKSQEWHCDCFSARWNQTCVHLEALQQHDERKAHPMTNQNPIETYPPAAAGEPERLVTGPRGTKILQTPADARAMKARRGRGHSGLKGAPRPAHIHLPNDDDDDDNGNVKEKANAL